MGWSLFILRVGNMGLDPMGIKIFTLNPEFWCWIFLLGLMALGIVLFPFYKNKKMMPLKERALFTLLFLSTSGLLYLCWGASPELVQVNALGQIRQSLEKITQNQNGTQESVLEEFDQLEKRLSYSHAALARLGNLYIELGLFERAYHAFDHAMQLAPQNNDYAAQWVYSHSLHSGGKLPMEVRIFAQNLLQKDPTQYALNNLLAVDDYFQENYQSAISRWQILLDTDTTLSDERRLVLENAILSAQKNVKMAAG